MAKSKQAIKKNLRIHISQTLEEIFVDFEQQLGKRKFRRNIKKASKALITDLKPEKREKMRSLTDEPQPKVEERFLAN